MRVGLITSEFPPDLGGVETYSWQLARELGRRNDLEVTVYAPPASAGIVMPDRVALKPIVTSCAGLDWAKLKKEPIDVWHALSAAHSWIALRDRPTVASVHGNDFLAPYPLTARPALSLPLLWRWRSWAWRAFEPQWQAATRRMLARSLPRCGTIIANSRYTAETLARLWPDCAARSRVGWVGVDPIFFDVAHRPRTGPPTLLTVARLSEPRKNVDLVLRALAALKDRFAFRYVVTGEGTERSRLVQLAASLGLASSLATQIRFDLNFMICTRMPICSCSPRQSSRKATRASASSTSKLLLPGCPAWQHDLLVRQKLSATESPVILSKNLTWNRLARHWRAFCREMSASIRSVAVVSPVGSVGPTSQILPSNPIVLRLCQTFGHEQSPFRPVGGTAH